MNAFEVCTLPLFLKLIFSEIRKWKSYWIPDSTVIPSDITSTIIELFDSAEEKFGPILVSHAVSFITASKSGLSESELEDIMSLDELVLHEVFQFNVPSSESKVMIAYTYYITIHLRLTGKLGNIKLI